MSHTLAQPHSAERPLAPPSLVAVLGWCSAPGTWYLALRLGYEATILTAREGPQMIGFSLLHASPLFEPSLVSVGLSTLWVLGVGAWLVRAGLRRERVRPRVWWQFAALALPLAVLWGLPAVSG